jgi:hypothetical protein
MTFWILFGFLALQLIATVAKAAKDGDLFTAVALVLFSFFVYCMWALSGLTPMTTSDPTPQPSHHLTQQPPSSMSPNRELLMHVMSKASGALLDSTLGNATARECWRAEIIALRDWLVPEEADPGMPDFPDANDAAPWQRWRDRQRLRDLLTAEADVALWLDLPIRLDKGTTQRGNGNGGTTTPKPPIKP